MRKPSHFEVELTDEAGKHYSALNDSILRRVNNAIDHLALNPFFGPNIVKLRGELKGYYRYRVGSYRIVYSVDEENRIVTVKGIFQRGRAYR